MTDANGHDTGNSTTNEVGALATCAICFIDLDPTIQNVIVPCSGHHQFHHDCLHDWFMTKCHPNLEDQEDYFHPITPTTGFPCPVCRQILGRVCMVRRCFNYPLKDTTTGRPIKFFDDRTYEDRELCHLHAPIIRCSSRGCGAIIDPTTFSNLCTYHRLPHCPWKTCWWPKWTTLSNPFFLFC